MPVGIGFLGLRAKPLRPGVGESRQLSRVRRPVFALRNKVFGPVLHVRVLKGEGRRTRSARPGSQCPVANEDQDELPQAGRQLISDARPEGFDVGLLDTADFHPEQDSSLSSRPSQRGGCAPARSSRPPALFQASG